MKASASRRSEGLSVSYEEKSSSRFPACSLLRTCWRMRFTSAAKQFYNHLNQDPPVCNGNSTGLEASQRLPMIQHMHDQEAFTPKIQPKT
eukprot:4434060-Amphidinium_carterae.3